MNTKSRGLFLATCAFAALALGGCGTITRDTINEKPPALTGDCLGKGFSQAVAFIPEAGNIPHVDASINMQARWAPEDRDQALYFDAYCQQKLFALLPRNCKQLQPKAVGRRSQRRSVKAM